MNDILAGLSKVADIVMTQIQKKISEVNAPRAIAETISKQSPAADGDTGAHIDITIDHPAAPAFEWGSGLHSTRGEKKKYPIPDEPTGVGIPVENWPKFKPPPFGTTVWFTQIKHPGVEKRPFIAPSVVATMPEVKKILGASMKAQLMRGVKVYEEIVIK